MKTGVEFSTMPGREVLACAIRDIKARAEFGRSCVDAYGAAAIGAGLHRNIGLDAATAEILAELLNRASGTLADLPKDKEGKPMFMAKVRFETTQEIVKLFAGAYRAAYVQIPAEPQPEKSDAAA